MEVAIILLIALIVIGPRKLPQLMRDVGKLMGQLRRASDDLRREILFSDEINQVKRAVNDALDPEELPPVPPKLKVKQRDSLGEPITEEDGKSGAADFHVSATGNEEETTTEKDAPGDGE